MTARIGLPTILALVAILAAGCSGPVTHDYQGVGVKYWNKSALSLHLKFESALGVGPDYSEFGPSSLSEGGLVSLSCNVGVDDPWWLRITVVDNGNGQERPFYWSDVGCGTKYLFTYHEDGSVTMVLTEKTPSMTRSDLPKP